MLYLTWYQNLVRDFNVGIGPRIHAMRCVGMGIEVVLESHIVQVPKLLNVQNRQSQIA
jgi:hypothetical protein